MAPLERPLPLVLPVEDEVVAEVLFVVLLLLAALGLTVKFAGSACPGES